ncbi:hypothetical protein [Microbispora triticiradicis]|uniref:hypothetical protein n=1 Tax=Microbispora triticiradicis TaxID=2200763 RepID=UPI001AD7A59A|nr:hypothetical protein [Microbispora triticiradicis]MBO4273110.1 hypothetical protein [Microbispora triticiradicis]
MTAIELLVVFCDACRKPIADGDGYLHVDHRKIAEYREHQAASRDAVEVVGVSLAEFLAAPDPARWQAHHTVCAPDDGGASYDVPVAQVRTWPRLASTTARLMGKTWLQHTDWDAVLEGAASAGGRRVSRTALREAS